MNPPRTCEDFIKFSKVGVNASKYSRVGCGGFNSQGPPESLGTPGWAAAGSTARAHQKVQGGHRWHWVLQGGLRQACCGVNVCPKGERARSPHHRSLQGGGLPCHQTSRGTPGNRPCLAEAGEKLCPDCRLLRLILWQRTR